MIDYLDPDERREIATAMLATAGYGPAERTAIIADLPLWVRGQLPGGQAAPRVAAMLDLAWLGTIERLSDGSVPLKTFLEAVLYFAGSNVAADPIRRKLAEVDAQATGAPPVPPSPPEEIQEKYVTRTAMVPRRFLDGALEAAKAVAKLSVRRVENGQVVQRDGEPVVYVGTGWLIGSGLMITNHHVINARNQGEALASGADFEAQLAGTTARFDYDEENLAGTEIAAGELVAADRALDYALFRVVSNRTPLEIAREPILNVVPEEAAAVNIIQHPDGHAKKWGVRNNLVFAATAVELRYFTDTLNGSSGSPVLNDEWKAVALHRGSKFVTGVQFQGRSVAYVNVGTQISAILDHLAANHAGKVPELSQ
ncbi:trypsin-like peptidase domain-containing protein [Sphingomonas lacusdianchii]|uniref:trypsin-like peptidase domain-containing protein n=1 Tax=Sphingomonas lacusdianchii TaxID=2917992 RepID=UPI001F591FCC|nr:trypsin-like peptidase domain-containing protein [Sphingomonas sp. JXJ CY 53]